MGLVLEFYGDPVAGERPELLAQPVVEFSRPLASQKRLDRLTPGEKFVAIAPFGVLAVSKGNALGIPRIPTVLGGFHFRAGRLFGEWRPNRRRTAGGLLRMHVATSCPVSRCPKRFAPACGDVGVRRQVTNTALKSPSASCW